ncbi:MAG: hypothetical protein J2P34_09555, partial [Actinobacteria bacterium]|nr:hypothetical protein [Actinomycetota bacterium]
MTGQAGNGQALRCGVVLPGGTAVEQLGQAALAEQAGWDGVLVWKDAAGIGALGTGLPDTGEVTGVRERADLLGEGIDLIRACGRGSADITGGITATTATATTWPGPPSRRSSGYPIWVVAVWRRLTSM